MKAFASLVAVLLLSPLDSRSDVHRRCVQCSNQCFVEHRAGPDRADCLRQCFRMKALDCKQNGHGPGPRKTCSCT